MEANVSAWTQALWVTPRRVCGRRLRPLSLAHLSMLSAVSSPLLAVDQPPSLCGLLTAVYICSRTHAELIDYLVRKIERIHAEGPVKHRPRRAAQIGPMLAGWWWVRRDWRREWREMVAHMADYRRYAPRDEAPPTRIAAPVEWHLVRVLCCEWGMDYEQAWDTPINVAVCCVDCGADARGDERLISESEVTRRKIVRDMVAARDSGDTRKADELQALLGAMN